MADAEDEREVVVEQVDDECSWERQLREDAAISRQDSACWDDADARGNGGPADAPGRARAVAIVKQLLGSGVAFEELHVRLKGHISPQLLDDAVAEVLLGGEDPRIRSAV